MILVDDDRLDASGLISRNHLLQIGPNRMGGEVDEGQADLLGHCRDHVLFGDDAFSDEQRRNGRAFTRLAVENNLEDVA